jgi:cytochrome P450
MVFGHIPLMKALRNGLPGDAHDTYVARKLCLNWQEYFPGASAPPPLAYLDLWPFLSQPLIMVYSPLACSQLTQTNPQPRHSLFRWALFPLTGGQDLTSVDVSAHRVWRSRLNPGFSPKNLISHMDVLLEEAIIFAQKLKTKVGDNNTWGDVFTLYDDVVNLTFDMIVRVTL